jgi:hypothetical protein
MKTQINTKSGHNVVNPVGQRPAGARAHAAKATEHRYERRKIHERLRRLDWLLNAEDEIFA